MVCRSTLGVLGLAAGVLGIGGGGWWLVQKRGQTPEENRRGICFPRAGRSREVGHAQEKIRDTIKILILGDGCAGAENQSKGLVEHLERLAARRGLIVECTVQRLQQAQAFRLLPPSVHIFLAGLLSPLWLGLGLHDKDSGRWSSEFLEGPFPDLVIGSGRTTAPACVAVRRASGRHVFAVQVQDPRCRHSLFDAVVTPAHDAKSCGMWALGNFSETWVHDRLWRWEGRRILTIGSLHGITEDVLKREVDENGHLISKHVSQARFLVGLLVGGPTGRCPWQLSDLLDEIQGLTRSSSGEEGVLDVGIVVLLSRRTPVQVTEALKAWAAAPPSGAAVQVFSSDDFPGGRNPYKAVLGMSHAVVVTADSVSMCSEAVAVSRPVFAACRSKCRGKLVHLHTNLEEMCGVHRSVEGRSALEICSMGRARAPRDTDKVAQMLWKRLQKHLRGKL